MPAQSEQTMEAIAFKLMETIADVEKKFLSDSHGKTLAQGYTVADRSWILSTYAECIKTVYAKSYKAKTSS